MAHGRRARLAVTTIGVVASLLPLAGPTPASAAPGWSSPAVIAKLEPFGEAPELSLAGAPSGRLVAVWTHRTGKRRRIEYAVRPAGGKWGRPHRLTGVSITERTPRIGMDDLGRATVAFEDRAGRFRRVRVVKIDARGHVGRPVTLARFTRDIGPPSLAVNGRGAAVLAWTEVLPGDAEAVHVSQRPVGGRFGRPAILSRDGRPQVAIDDAGNAALFVSAFADPQSDSLLLRPAGGSFGPARVLNQGHLGELDLNGTTAAIEMTGGVAVIAWAERGGGVSALLAPVSGPLPASERVNSGTTRCGFVHLAVDQAGDAVLAADCGSAADEDFRDVFFALRAPGAAFGASATLEPAGGRVCGGTAVLATALGAAGDGIVAWNTCRTDSLMAAVRPRAGAFGPPARIAPSADELASASVDRNGGGALVWADIDHSNDRLRIRGAFYSPA